MKIACDACEAKYSISDDKVRGKVFKIRCKKCSNVIVVRGVESAPVVVAPPSDDDRVWHLVVHQDQIGPLTIDEVRTRFRDGDIDAETYTWREGQADWLPLASIEELAMISAPTRTLDAIAESDVAKLRGERNQSSVLFSLGNLAQIATRTPARASASGGLEAHAASTQEGSGLIDIRSMASAYLGSGMTAKPAASIGSLDDLPVFNTGSAFSEPTVLVPSPVRAASSKLMYAMIAAIVAFATVAIVLLVMLLHRDPVVVARTEPPTPPPAAASPSPPAPVVVQPPAPPPSPPEAPKAPEAPAPKQPAPKVRPKTAIVAPTPKQAKTDPPARDDCDEIYCVVNTEAACCKSHPAKAPPKQPPPRSDLPEQLTPAMITTAMNAVRSRVMTCGDKSSAKGRVRVHLRVANEGKITNIAVEETPDAGLGACVVAAVGHATFPSTQAGRSFSVPYTF